MQSTKYLSAQRQCHSLQCPRTFITYNTRRQLALQKAIFCSRHAIYEESPLVLFRSSLPIKLKAHQAALIKSGAPRIYTYIYIHTYKQAIRLRYASFTRTRIHKSYKSLQLLYTLTTAYILLILSQKLAGALRSRNSSLASIFATRETKQKKNKKHNKLCESPSLITRAKTSLSTNYSRVYISRRCFLSAGRTL